MISQNAAFYIQCGLAVAFALAFLVIRLQNPALTETQLFLRFWPVIAGWIALALLVKWRTRKDTR